MLTPFGMLVNTATGRFHPIVFRPEPPPGTSGVTLQETRWRSRGHHTEGFDTRAAAMAHVASERCWWWTGLEWEWAGDGIPAMTVFLDESTATEYRGD